MSKATKKYLYIFSALLLAFVVFTILVKCIDVCAIGPNGSSVGFATFNNWVHNETKVNFTLYNISDIGGIPPFGFVIVFGLVGLVQLIKRKNLLKVDKNILALGVFFIITLMVFVLFQVVVINYRPVLIDGNLEASYPSSTTILSIATLVTGIMQIDKYVSNTTLKRTLQIICGVYGVLLVVCRLISGVHWASDIIGAILISSALVYLYLFLNSLFEKIIK